MITSSFLCALQVWSALGSSVGITTDYRLDGPRIESRWEREFMPVLTDSVAHTASCTMGTGSFPGVKGGRGVKLNPHPLLVPWSWKSRAIPLPTVRATTGSVTESIFTSMELTYNDNRHCVLHFLLLFFLLCLSLSFSSFKPCSSP